MLEAITSGYQVVITKRYKSVVSESRELKPGISDASYHVVAPGVSVSYPFLLTPIFFVVHWRSSDLSRNAPTIMYIEQGKGEKLGRPGMPRVAVGKIVPHQWWEILSPELRCSIAPSLFNI
jgi:hypothetical protein